MAVTRSQRWTLLVTIVLLFPHENEGLATPSKLFPAITSRTPWAKISEQTITCAITVSAETLEKLEKETGDKSDLKWHNLVASKKHFKLDKLMRAKGEDGISLQSRLRIKNPEEWHGRPVGCSLLAGREDNPVSTFRPVVECKTPPVIWGPVSRAMLAGESIQFGCQWAPCGEDAVAAQDPLVFRTTFGQASASAIQTSDATEFGIKYYKATIAYIFPVQFAGTSTFSVSCYLNGQSDKGETTMEKLTAIAPCDTLQLSGPHNAFVGVYYTWECQVYQCTHVQPQLNVSTPDQYTVPSVYKIKKMTHNLRTDVYTTTARLRLNFNRPGVYEDIICTSSLEYAGLVMTFNVKRLVSVYGIDHRPAYTTIVDNRIDCSPETFPKRNVSAKVVRLSLGHMNKTNSMFTSVDVKEPDRLICGGIVQTLATLKPACSLFEQFRCGITYADGHRTYGLFNRLMEGKKQSVDLTVRRIKDDEKFNMSCTGRGFIGAYLEISLHFCDDSKKIFDRNFGFTETEIADGECSDEFSVYRSIITYKAKKEVCEIKCAMLFLMIEKIVTLESDRVVLVEPPDYTLTIILAVILAMFYLLFLVLLIICCLRRKNAAAKQTPEYTNPYAISARPRTEDETLADTGLEDDTGLADSEVATNVDTGLTETRQPKRATFQPTQGTSYTGTTNDDTTTVGKDEPSDSESTEGQSTLVEHDNTKHFSKYH